MELTDALHETDALDDYQALAATTAIYPRVYTEHQVRTIVVAALYAPISADPNTEALANRLLDEHETPFNRLVYPVLGLVGEAGEIANKLKKVARDDQGAMDLDQSDAIEKETGDVLWYIAAITNELRVKLSQVAKDNIDKLFSRKERGVLGGSGDTR